MKRDSYCWWFGKPAPATRCSGNKCDCFGAFTISRDRKKRSVTINQPCTCCINLNVSGMEIPTSKQQKRCILNPETCHSKKEHHLSTSPCLGSTCEFFLGCVQNMKDAEHRNKNISRRSETTNHCFHRVFWWFVLFGDDQTNPINLLIARRFQGVCSVVHSVPKMFYSFVFQNAKWTTNVHI